MFGNPFENKQSADPRKRGRARSCRVGEILMEDDRLQ